MKDYKQIIASLLNKESGVAAEEINELIEIPPEKSMGDYALPCFFLAKALKKSPVMIAEDLKNKIESNEFSKIENKGPYLNFFVKSEDLIENVVSEILSNENYGSSNIGQGKTVTFDFSSTNIAKPFHIGHLRSTVIGNSLRNIFKFNGYNTVAINYLGDYGTQFGVMLAAYKLFGDKEKISQNPIKELLNLYVEYTKLQEEDESKKDDARAWFKKLEDGDKEAVELWTWFKEISLKEFNRVYKLLGIEFDSFDGEAFSSKFVDDVIKELREKDILVKSDGAEIIEFDDDNIPNVIIVKSNGTSTYIVRDIATALYRKRNYDFFKNIYVVGGEQKLHFTQLFAILQKMGYDFSKDCEHISFGLILLKDMRLSTRKGQVVFLEDVLNEAINKTMEIINQRDPNLENKEEISRQVGIGAVIFQDLYSNRIKDYTFDWEETLNFEGETGPYVQYSQARGVSILEKAGEIKKDVDFSKLSNEEEKFLAQDLYDFPEKVKLALEKREPSVIARHLVKIAKSFNKFYNTCHILSEIDEIKYPRLLLVEATVKVLRTGLGLLGISSPDKM
ncbi:arginine--tRNA ligase [Citroniella saccharovorans]|uniref:Arginine--tRNA ligase n=1 Tax=Citroniella saccharovorans TaxID=2053367 RepID=A0AAW9MYK9_9FIRM|nr:arginine--tRNA ligase [Citroniella saccharovorans]MEB3429722.1 arginine--tRNA ligase [Citroniella saccharovorans]